MSNYGSLLWWVLAHKWFKFIWNHPWNQRISLNALLCFVNASSFARPYCFRLSQEQAAENASSFLPCEHMGARFAYLKWHLSACNFKTFIISCICFSDWSYVCSLTKKVLINQLWQSKAEAFHYPVHYLPQWQAQSSINAENIRLLKQLLLCN